MSGDLYQDRVLEHYRNPRNVGVADPADADATLDNPLCGDEVRVTATVRDGRLADVRFEGRGCAISLASASLLTERVKGLTVEEARALSRDEVVRMIGVPVSPTRLKCALLAHGALVEALGQGGGNVS